MPTYSDSTVWPHHPLHCSENNIFIPFLLIILFSNEAIAGSYGPHSKHPTAATPWSQWEFSNPVTVLAQFFDLWGTQWGTLYLWRFLSYMDTLAMELASTMIMVQPINILLLVALHCCQVARSCITHSVDDGDAHLLVLEVYGIQQHAAKETGHWEMVQYCEPLEMCTLHTVGKSNSNVIAQGRCCQCPSFQMLASL